MLVCARRGEARRDGTRRRERRKRAWVQARDGMSASGKQRTFSIISISSSRCASRARSSPISACSLASAPALATSVCGTSAACGRMARARAAKCAAIVVWRWHEAKGRMVVSMSVFELPPIESARRRVSLWLRYGMAVAPPRPAAPPSRRGETHGPADGCAPRLESASRTSASAESDALIACASSCVLPVAPLCVRFSEPARSTRCTLPTRALDEPGSRDSTCRVSTACERDERALSLVVPVERAAAPYTTRSSSSAAERTGVRSVSEPAR